MLSCLQSSKCWKVCLEWRSSLLKTGYAGASWIKRQEHERCQTKLWDTPVNLRAIEFRNMPALCLFFSLWWPCRRRSCSSRCQSASSYSACECISHNSPVLCCEIWGLWWSGFWHHVDSTVDAYIDESTWFQNPEEHYHQPSSFFSNILYFCNITKEFQNFEITPEWYHLAVWGVYKYLENTFHVWKEKFVP